ncbi:MAG: aminoacyl-tRNA deacylase [Erysipelotrichaceae bacterium]|nr:aminoacyl-tRNA deacylase [Erysipelotrichaceae bacterium]
MKTNAMRHLDKAKIPYEVLTYDIPMEEFSGEAVSDLLGLPYEACYKTLGVTHGPDVYLCVIPVSGELDLKKAAKALRVKSLEMIHVRDLLKLVGYERGSVTPIAAKKNRGVLFDAEVLHHETIEISGGEFGIGLTVNRDDLLRFLNAKTAEITRRNHE